MDAYERRCRSNMLSTESAASSAGVKSQCGARARKYVHTVAERLSGAHQELRLRLQGLLRPGGGEGAVDILRGVEVQAEARQISAERQGRQVGVLHPDDAQQAHEAVGIRGRRLLRPRKLHAHRLFWTSLLLVHLLQSAKEAI